MKQISFVFGLVILFQFPALAENSPSIPATNQPTPADEIVARGKGFQVKRQKLDEAWAIYRARFSRNGKLPDEPSDGVETRLLNHIIETEILLQKATPEEKKKAEAATEQLMTDSRKRFATDEDFENWLRMMGMTPAQYRLRAVESRAAEMVIDREIGPGIVISDEQLKKYYDESAKAFDHPEQARGRQIFFSTIDPETQEPFPEAKQKEKEKLANEAKARLNRGEDFFKIYQEFSEEPWAKKEEAGDEMLYVRGQMPPEFDAVVFALKPNQISEVVHSRLGYSIIRISEIQPAGRMSLAEVAPRLKEFLVNEEIKKRLPDYLAILRAEAGVEFLNHKPAASATGPGPISVAN